MCWCGSGGEGGLGEGGGMQCPLGKEKEEKKE